MFHSTMANKYFFVSLPINVETFVTNTDLEVNSSESPPVHVLNLHQSIGFCCCMWCKVFVIIS